MTSAIAQLAEAGFDVIHDFDATAASREPGLAWLAGERGILIGNTRALWPPFVAAMRDPALAAEANPLERYTERTIEAAFPGARVYYSHRRYASKPQGEQVPSGHDGAFLPFQRVAVATGLGALAPSQLVIHPVFGPWFALRAIAIVAGAAPVRLPIAQPCRCESGCAEALARARSSTDWRAWLAVRDACTLSAQRYGEDQIRYHYTKVW